MKKFLKINIKVFVTMIITTIVVGSLSVYAASQYFARDITFIPTNENFKKENGELIENVEDALNELYNSKIDSEKCVSGIFHHVSKTQYNYDLSFEPSMFNATLKIPDGNLILIYNKKYDNNLYYFAPWEQQVSTSLNVSFNNGIMTSNIPTGYDTYLGEYDINYTACK